MGSSTLGSDSASNSPNPTAAQIIGSSTPITIAIPPVLGMRRDAAFTCPSIGALSKAPARWLRRSTTQVVGSEISNPAPISMTMSSITGSV